MDLRFEIIRAQTRRQFFARSGLSLGAMALSQLMPPSVLAKDAPRAALTNPLASKKPTFPAKAKSIIYLHMSGAPPSLDLFDYKPMLVKHNMEPCSDELLKGVRFAFIKGIPKMLGTPFQFKQYGRSGAWVSEMLPNFTEIVDDVALVKSMYTDQFNHAPAELFLLTGSARAGAASMGSWLTYGLGTENQDLPGFVVLLSGGTDPTGGKALWSSGFLPSVYQGVQCRSSGEPILYSNNPAGMDRTSRRRTLDALDRLNEVEASKFGDPETLARIAQYELAYRMQVSVPEVMDINKESKEMLEMYGAKPGAGSFANNCLLARRLVEKGVRYVQLFDWGWDIHGNGTHDDLLTQFPKKCRDVDKASVALIKDLKQRGLLDQTIVVWGGEFGRTPMNEERSGSIFLGRDHHPNCFTLWMAGGGFKGGTVYGETDELGYNVAKDKVSVHDLQATLMHLMGLDAFSLSYRYQGLDQRLIGPEGKAEVVKGLLT